MTIKNMAAKVDFTPYECPITGAFVPCIDRLPVIGADDYRNKKDAIAVAKSVYAERMDEDVKDAQPTAGPWDFEISVDGEKVFFGQDSDAYICSMNPDDPREEANARRILDCVNACEGINPKAVQKMLQRLKMSLQDARDARDDEDFVAESWNWQSMIDDIQAVIDEAEGRA